MSYQDLTPRERLSAVALDLMRDQEFCLMGGATQVGTTYADHSVPTAATNGRDKWYNAEWINTMTRPQLRYLVAHETFHCMLLHCVEYKDISAKYPRESNQAQDYCINGMIESMGLARGFVQRPENPGPLVDPLYTGKSFLEILSLLLKNKPPPDGPGKYKSDSDEGGGQGFDEHRRGESALTEEETKDLKQDMQDAVHQGQMLKEQMDRKRGQGSGSNPLEGMQERRTDWRPALRKFLEGVTEGDAMSTYAPPNKRLMAAGLVLPSHFSESIGELVVACDCSGSMHGVYPVVFGEIARLCQQMRPAKVRMLWWSDKVEGDQQFTEKDYAQIAKVLKPRGGGGTTVSCVAEYIKEHRIKAKAVVVLTDGLIEHNYTMAPIPHLWAVVDHPGFRPIRGKTLHIPSALI